MEHFNKLTPAETETLDILAEECAEVIQAISKIKRFGLHSSHPRLGTMNVELLAREIGDMFGAVVLLQVNVPVSQLHEENLERLAVEKFKKFEQYTHHVRLRP